MVIGVHAWIVCVMKVLLVCFFWGGCGADKDTIGLAQVLCVCVCVCVVSSSSFSVRRSLFADIHDLKFALSQAHVRLKTMT